MNVSEIYKKAVKIGMLNDPRGYDTADRDLKLALKEFESLQCKEYFDKERLVNPYIDTRILHDSGQEPVKTVLCGIDIDTSELLLADRLGLKSESAIDLVITHHPEGHALAMLHDVMKIQAKIFNRQGVPINVAESIMAERMKEVERKIMPLNHEKSVDAAKLLNISLLCIHTPADNMVHSYLQRIFDERNPNEADTKNTKAYQPIETLDDIINALLEIDEYKESAKGGVLPKITVGDPTRTAGRVVVDMTGGTEGHEDIYKTLPQSGINTIVCMHQSEEHKKKAEEAHVNVVIAGHIASDNLGLNLLFDEIFENTSINVLSCSGFRRFKRK